MDRRELSPTIFETNLFYLFIALALLFIGSYFQNRDIYSGLVVTEYLIILLPTLVYLKVRKYSLKKVLRLNRLSLKQILLIPLITLFAYPVGAFLNYIMIIIISFFGSVKPSPVPIPNTGSEFLLGIIIIAVSAGICEEILFRGTLLRGFEKLGPAKSIILTAILFGMWHMYFTSFLGTFLLGLLIGYIVYRTNSLYCGMFAHFINNSAAVLLGFAAQYILDRVQTKGIDDINAQLDINSYYSELLNGPSMQLVGIIVGWGFIILFCSAVITGLIIGLNKTTAGKAERQEGTAISSKPKHLLWLLPGVGLIGFIYYAEALHLMGVQYHTVDTILKFIGLK